MSGIEACRNAPYRAVTRRGSSTATTPRSDSRRISRPEPWASSSAAWVAATFMNPFPPASATARCRAMVSGSSGRGNGIRSMITSWQVAPGTSTPCHSERVPNRLACSSRTKRRVSSGSWASPWHRMVMFGSCRRTCTAAVSAARRELNNPKVRPPAAQTNSAISARTASDMPSRPGGGRLRAT